MTYAEGWRFRIRSGLIWGRGKIRGGVKKWCEAGWNGDESVESGSGAGGCEGGQAFLLFDEFCVSELYGAPVELEATVEEFLLFGLGEVAGEGAEEIVFFVSDVADVEGDQFVQLVDDSGDFERSASFIEVVGGIELVDGLLGPDVLLQKAVHQTLLFRKKIFGRDRAEQDAFFFAGVNIADEHSKEVDCGLYSICIGDGQVLHVLKMARADADHAPHQLVFFGQDVYGNHNTIPLTGSGLIRQ